MLEVKWRCTLFLLFGDHNYTARIGLSQEFWYNFSNINFGIVVCMDFSQFSLKNVVYISERYHPLKTTTERKNQMTDFNGLPLLLCKKHLCDLGISEFQYYQFLKDPRLTVKIGKSKFISKEKLMELMHERSPNHESQTNL